MSGYKTAIAALLVVVLGFATAGEAAGRGGHAGGPAVHGGAGGWRGAAGGVPGHGGDFHGHPGAFHDHFRGRTFIGVAPFVWAPGYVYAPPVVEAPPVYGPDPSGYWYYCPSAGAYYPTVPACSEPWVPVPAG